MAQLDEWRARHALGRSVNQALTASAPAATIRRYRLLVKGQVQGVGFRPHTWRCAEALGLSGWVFNNGDGVTIEVEGERAQDFESVLIDTLPPLAQIQEVHSERVALEASHGFSIRPSTLTAKDTAGEASVPADVGICGACLKELFDPADRRYLHPFIACTDCGPRYSMARSLPYDRDTTAMADFELCPSCSDEYQDPARRRFHAEPIACHDCGPRLSHPIAAITGALNAGQTVALKGLGGYHLICDASNEQAVKRLRERKYRDAKPFALMLLNRESAGRCVRIRESSAALLEGSARPIVIAQRQDDCTLPDALAPGLNTLGVMLPHTGVHYLLFHDLLGRPEGNQWLKDACAHTLLFTSANRSGEPMLIDDDQARDELASIADLIVSHDREITHSCDDSVLRATASGHAMIRRGRGYAPGSYALVSDGPTVLALGAHLKNTVCVARGEQAFMSSHIGDLDSPAMHRLIDVRARELLDWLRAEPSALVCDLHPDYASTRLAERLALELEMPLFRVQHHHAHIAAITAAAKHSGPVLGVALDGHGLGLQGESWGGELLSVDRAKMKRIGHLRSLVLPGGDQATRQPWRIAAGFAASVGRSWSVPGQRAQQVAAIGALARSVDCPRTSACGRYFDAAAALLGLTHLARYEAEAPMRLEASCRRLRCDPALYRIEGGVLDLYPLLEQLIDVESAIYGAELFHGTLVTALTEWVSQTAEHTGSRVVALGGGCFQNAILAAELPRRLRATGFTVLTESEVLTPGDGGLSLGQAVIAREILDRRDSAAVGSPEGAKVCA